MARLPLNGQNIPATVFVGKQRFGDDTLVSMQLREKVTKHEDQYLGADRARHDKQVDGVKLNITVHVIDNGLFQALIKQQEQRDNRQPIDDITVVFRMQTRDGAAPKAYAAQNVVTEMKLDASARNKRATIELDCDADRLVPVVA